MTSLVSLAEDLLAQAKQIEKILVRNKIPNPSFEEDTLDSLPEDVQNLRWDLLDTIHSFRQLVRGPRLGGLDIALGWTEHLILRIIWRYELASAVPIHGIATYQEISATSGLSESLVARTIRAAIPLNIFDEVGPGQVRHTALSRILATDRDYYQFIGLQVQDWGPASTNLIEAWERFGDNGEPDRSAYSLTNDGKSVFTVLAQDSKRAHRFDAAMRYCIRDTGMNLFNIINAFDWSTLDQSGAVLIDLGGGRGHISQILAQHTQHLAFIVQDLPHVIEQSQKELPLQFSERVRFEAQDFMQDQAPRDGRPITYLISRCLHNWSDYHCSRILRALIPALKEGSQVLIWDTVLNDKPAKKFSEKFNFQQDFIMATMCNGKDRTAAEFRQVLEISDPRFVMGNIKRPQGSNLSMINVSWSGET